MTTGPRLRRDGSYLPGVLAVGLFVAIALVVVNAPFAEARGFAAVDSITAELGYALFGFDDLAATGGGMDATEPFLVSLLLIAVVLDAALDAALVLAKREEAGEPVTALAGASDRDAGTRGSRAGAASGGDPVRGPAAADGGSGDDVVTDGGPERGAGPSDDGPADGSGGDGA